MKKCSQTIAALTLLCILLLSSVPTLCQGDTKHLNIQWKQPLGKTSNNQILQTSDGGYLLGCTVQVPTVDYLGYPYEATIASLIKCDTAGNIVWNKQYEEAWTFVSIINTLDAGYAFATNRGLYKVDSAGKSQWNQTCLVKDDSYNIQFIGQTSSGFYMILYESDDHSFVAKLDSDGNILWNKEYDTKTGCSIFYCATLLDSGMVLCGNQLVKIDYDGKILWIKYFSRGFGSILSTSDGGFLLTGPPEYPQNNIALKTDSQGNIQWTHRENGYGGLYMPIQTSDEGYLGVGGKPYDFEKLSASGVVEWKEKVVTVDEMYFVSGNFFSNLVLTRDGGLIFVYREEYGDEQYWDSFLVKMAPMNFGHNSQQQFSFERIQKQWEKNFSGISYTSNIVKASDGGYVFGSHESQYVSFDFFTFYSEATNIGLLYKTDSSGNLQWKKNYTSDNGGIFITRVGLANDGGYLLCGYQARFPIMHSCEDDVGLLIKTDSAGNMQWQKTFRESDYAVHLTDFVQSSDDNYFVYGTVSDVYYGHHSYGYMKDATAIIIKVNPAGNVLWQKIFGETGNQYRFNSAILTDTGILACGYHYDNPKKEQQKGHSNAAIIKIDFNGEVKWTKNYEDFASLKYVFHSPDGGYFLFGHKSADVTFSSNYGESIHFTGGFFLKTDENANTQWSKTYSANFVSPIQTNDQKYLVLAVEPPDKDSYIDSYNYIEKISGSGKIEVRQLNLDLPTKEMVLSADGEYVFLGMNILGVWIAKAAETDGSSVNYDAQSSIMTIVALVIILAALSVTYIYLSRRAQAKKAEDSFSKQVSSSF
jgi:hypothetical protein